MDQPKLTEIRQNQNFTQTLQKKWELTGLRYKQEEYNNGGKDSDEAARERPAVEILVDLGVRVEIPQLIEDLHGRLLLVIEAEEESKL